LRTGRGRRERGDEENGEQGPLLGRQ